MNDYTQKLVLHILNSARLSRKTREIAATAALLIIDTNDANDEGRALNVIRKLQKEFLHKKNLKMSRSLIDGMIKTADKETQRALLKSPLIWGMTHKQFERAFRPLFVRKNKTRKDCELITQSLARFLRQNPSQSEKYLLTLKQMMQKGFPREDVCSCICQFRITTNEMLNYLDGSLRSSSSSVQLSALCGWAMHFWLRNHPNRKMIDRYLKSSTVAQRIQNLARRKGSKAHRLLSKQAVDALTDAFPRYKNA